MGRCLSCRFRQDSAGSGAGVEGTGGDAADPVAMGHGYILPVNYLRRPLL